MAVPRQDDGLQAGRVNQKRRTRAAIVEAAQRLVDRGTTPTVAAAAEEALVSRTTAYRYFPTQESLLLELSVTMDVPELEAIVARPVDADEVGTRIVEVFDTFNRHVLADEALYRRAIRTYLDMWLATHEADPTEQPTVRAGRRMRWITRSVEPLEATMDRADLDRLKAALAMVMGTEAIFVMRDVCGLAPDDALAVSRWAAEVILEAGVRDAHG